MIEMFTAMAHLYKRHSRALIIYQFGLYFLQHFKRQSTRSRAEVMNTVNHEQPRFNKVAKGSTRHIDAVEYLAITKRSNDFEYTLSDRRLRLDGGSTNMVGAINAGMASEG